MNRIGLIAMDMDGTLLDGRQRIPRANIEALKAAANGNVRLAICSGRNPRDISFYASDAGLDRCAVLGINGSCCLEAPHREPYAVRYLAPAVAARAVQTLLGYRITFACFQPDRVLVVPLDSHVQKREWGTYVARGKADAYEFGEATLARRLEEGICKIACVDAEDSQRLSAVRAELSADEGLQVTASWSTILELMPRGVGKGAALRELAERLHVPREAVMALGDYDNDLDMIEYAGFGVAMGNATERVRQAAQAQTLTNLECGVAAAIRKYVLEA